MATLLQPHWHYQPLIQPERCADSCQGNIVRVNQCLKKGIGHVDLWPNLSSSTICEDIIDARCRMCVQNGVRIKDPVVINPAGHCKGISLWYYKGGGCMCWVQWSYTASIEVFLDQHSPSILVLAWHTIWSCSNRFWWVFQCNSGVKIVWQFTRVWDTWKNISIVKLNIFPQFIQFFLGSETFNMPLNGRNHVERFHRDQRGFNNVQSFSTCWL